MKRLQSYENSTFQVRLDKGWWKILSQLRTDTGKSFKELVEGALSDAYGIDKDGKPYEIKNT